MKQGRDSSLRLTTLSLLLLSLLVLFCKPFVIESLFLTSETFLCSVLDLQLKTVLLLDALQLLMLPAGTLICLKQKMFPSIIFYYKHGILQFVR
jgi:hypothetical protein